MSNTEAADRDTSAPAAAAVAASSAASPGQHHAAQGREAAAAHADAHYKEAEVDNNECVSQVSCNWHAAFKLQVVNSVSDRACSH